MSVSTVLGRGRFTTLPVAALVVCCSLAHAQPPDTPAGADDTAQPAPAETTPVETVASLPDGDEPQPPPPAEPQEDVVKSTPGRADVTIDLKPSAILEGHDLRATIKVQPDSDNRLLAVVIDAPTFYASTERELMGASSPRTYTFKWEKLPAGMYRVEAVVTDAAGRVTRIHRDFQVHGGTLDGEMVPTTPTPGRRRRRQ